MADKRNPHWDAVCGYFGLRPVTRAEMTRVGRLARDLKLKCGDDDPAEKLEAMGKAYKKTMPAGCLLTPEALLKHWDQVAQLAVAKRPQSREEAEREAQQRYAEIQAERQRFEAERQAWKRQRATGRRA